MRQTNKQPNAQSKTPEPDDDPVPADMDEFRNELARRIRRFIGNRKEYWRGCKKRDCRRQKACFASTVRCSNAPPHKSSPEQWPKVMAQVQRALRERLAKEEGP